MALITVASALAPSSRQHSQVGVDIALVYNRSRAEADDTATRFVPSVRAFSVQADVASDQACRMQSRHRARARAVDILINMASSTSRSRSINSPPRIGIVSSRLTCARRSCSRMRPLP